MFSENISLFLFFAGTHEAQIFAREGHATTDKSVRMSALRTKLVVQWLLLRLPHKVFYGGQPLPSSSQCFFYFLF